MLSRCGQCHQRLLLALLALLLAPVLCHAGTTTALEDLVLSQLNVTTVAAFGDAIESNPNFTIPTMMDFVAPLKSGVPTVRFQAVATDTYILSQEKLDYIVHVKEESRLFALGVVLRASAVRGCTAVHAMCCTYYWVTDAYPPGLSLADLDTSLIFWDGHSTNSSVDVAFAKTFDGVDCSEPESLIPNSQKRPVATYTVPMVMTWGSGAEVLRWDFMGTLTYGYARYFEMHSTYNSGNATLNEKILDPIVARLFEPFGDPWSLLGEEAMAFRPTVGSENVTSTRSNAFGYIPVVAPIVVSAVLIVALFIFLIVTFCCCEQKWKRLLDEAQYEEAVTDDVSLGSRASSARAFSCHTSAANVDVESQQMSTAAPSFHSVRKPPSRQDSFNVASAPLVHQNSVTSSQVPSTVVNRNPNRNAHRRGSGQDRGSVAQPSPSQIANPLAGGGQAPSFRRAPSVSARPQTSPAPVPVPAPQQRALSNAGNCSSVANSFRQTPSMRVSPSGGPQQQQQQQQPPLPTYVVAAQQPYLQYNTPQSAPFMLPSVPIVATPSPSTSQPPTTTTTPVPKDSPGAVDADGLPRQASGLRRKSSMVSWNLKDLEM